jgi:hypothetical protein
MKYRIVFLGITCVLGIVSGLLHEFGHVLFYWFQDIPAGMSLVMEFPLIDISARQYEIGSLGGPLMNVILIMGAFLFTKRFEVKSTLWTIFSALLVGNSFYFFFRVLLGLAKNDFGEIEYAMNIVGLNEAFAAVGFLLISIVVLAAWVRNSNIKLSSRNLIYYFLIFICYLFLMSGIEKIDKKYLWNRYPAVEIEGVRIHNPK